MDKIREDEGGVGEEVAAGVGEEGEFERVVDGVSGRGVGEEGVLLEGPPHPLRTTVTLVVLSSCGGIFKTGLVIEVSLPPGKNRARLDHVLGSVLGECTPVLRPHVLVQHIIVKDHVYAAQLAGVVHQLDDLLLRRAV